MGDITVDHSKCDGCGECMSVCPNEVFEFNDDDKSVPANMDDCDDCCSCVESCPNEAITNSEC